MKLFILYGNADEDKRQELAKRIMEKDKNTLVQYPECCLPMEKSFEEEEEKLMEICSLNLIFLESEASSYELAMVKYKNLPYKILYSDFNSKNSNNYLLKNSGFIHNIIKKNESVKDNVINIKPNNIEIVKVNNFLTDVHLKYDINSFMIKIPKEIEEIEYVEVKKIQFLILNIRIKYIELVNFLEEVLFASHSPKLDEFNIQKFESFEEIVFRKKIKGKNLSKAIWNKWKLKIIKVFLNIDKSDERTANELINLEDYKEKVKVRQKIKELDDLVSNYLGA